MWSLGWRLKRLLKILVENDLYECSDRDQTYKKIVIEYGNWEETMQAVIYSNGSQECGSLLLESFKVIHKYELGGRFTQKQNLSCTYPQVSSLGDETRFVRDLIT